MKRLLLPVLMALVGLGGGVGAGLFLRPPPEEAAAMADPCGEATTAHEEEPVAEGDGGEATHDYVKLNNQFVVPVVESSAVSALVILSISLEVKLGMTEAVYAQEPKLRDLFLQVLFDHANSGGFAGSFTEANTMDVLRDALLETARTALGSDVTDVLIVDIVRQDT
jgi:flagellar protein FliL